MAAPSARSATRRSCLVRAPARRRRGPRRAGLIRGVSSCSSRNGFCYSLLLSYFFAGASLGCSLFVAPFPERVGEGVILGEADLVARLLEQGGGEAGEGAFHVDRVGKVGGDLHVLGEQAEREAGRERAGNHVLLHDILGVEIGRAAGRERE